MAKSFKRSRGDVGEDICCRYLEAKGFEILERNYLRPWGEIDIVARQGKILHFIEVKTGSRVTNSNNVSYETSKIRPEENMHTAKIRRLQRAIQTYLIDHKVPECTEWGLDLYCVYLDYSTRKARVEFFENIGL